jgi:hypothetical protein
MLQCNMTISLNIQLALEDLLADLRYARRHDQLGRLALLAYCEVKGWARMSGRPDLADISLRMFSEKPSVSKVEFLENIDTLIATLELHEEEYRRANMNKGASGPVSSAVGMNFESFQVSALATGDPIDLQKIDSIWPRPLRGGQL